MSVEFAHPVLDQEVTAIGGHYVLTKEDRLPFRSREVLYLVGQVVVNNSCCAQGGFGYALVPGFVDRWHCGQNPAGLVVSEVEPIADPAVRAEVTRLIEALEVVNQVNFL